MPSTATVVLLLLPVLLFTAWHISSTVAPPPIPSNLRNKSIILLIAHPDDESMFFSPTLQALTDPALGNHLKILCMSTGDADGLGETRRKELQAAALTLGLRQPQDVFVMDDERFKDGMKEDWQARDIARVLAQAFSPELIANTSTALSSSEKGNRKSDITKSKTVKSSSSATPTKSSSKSLKPSNNKSTSLRSSTRSTPTTQTTASSSPDRPRASVDIILTFDSSGISNHPNHISLYHGAVLYIQHLTKDHPGHRSPVDLYTLTSINMLRKYSFCLDVIPTYISGIFSSIMNSFSARNTRRSRDDRRSDQAVFVSDVTRYIKARRAMVSGHKSQMVWFRWGWIGLGRYMVVNDLKRESIVGV